MTTSACTLEPLLYNRSRFGYNLARSGRGAARLARTVRVGEVGGSNPLAPTYRVTILSGPFSFRSKPMPA